MAIYEIRGRSVKSSRSIAPGITVELKASTGRPWTEQWSIDSPRIWHCSYSTLPAVSLIANGRRQPTWLPYPGETLTVPARRPSPIEGRASTIQRVHYDVPEEERDDSSAEGDEAGEGDSSRGEELGTDGSTVSDSDASDTSGDDGRREGPSTSGREGARTNAADDRGESRSNAAESRASETDGETSSEPGSGYGTDGRGTSDGEATESSEPET